MLQHCYSTPHSELANRIRATLQDRISPDGGKTKVVERGGDKISKGLYRADPFGEKFSPFNRKCPANGHANCTLNRVVYEIECLLCKNDHLDDNAEVKRAIYRGQTGCSLHKRLIEHEDDLKRGQAQYGISKHFKITHPTIDTNHGGLVMAKVVGHRVFNMERCIEEALCIEQIEMDAGVEVLNSKA